MQNEIIFVFLVVTIDALLTNISLFIWELLWVFCQEVQGKKSPVHVKVIKIITFVNCL